MRVTRSIRAAIRRAVVAELGYRPAEIRVARRHERGYVGEYVNQLYLPCLDDDLTENFPLSELTEIEPGPAELDLYIYDDLDLDTNVGVLLTHDGRVHASWSTSTEFEERPSVRAFLDEELAT